jgi:uridine phosphorylase
MRNLTIDFSIHEINTDLPVDNDRPVLTAAGMLEYRRRSGTAPKVSPPHAAILCFQPGLLSEIKKRYRLKKIDGFFGDFYLVKSISGEVAVLCNFGIGAPAAVVLLEDLAAFGVKRFISIGLAGGLQGNMRFGDIVIPEKAIRGEGTSSYYQEPSLYAVPSPLIQRSLQAQLQAMQLAYRSGTTWTTDAPYREMRSIVQDYQERGVLAVDMEASALFAAGRCLGIQIGAAFSIADTLNGLQWRFSPASGSPMNGLVSLFEAALQVLTQE